MREALWSKGLIGKDRRVGKLSFWETSFTFSGVVFSTPLFLLWHRRLGHVSSPRLRYFISTGMLGSVPNIEISTCMGCKLRKDSALPLLILKTLFLLLFLILCPKPILPLCYRKEAVYVIFYIRMKKLTKIKVFRSSSWGEYISAAFRTLLASTHFIYKALSQRSCPHTPQQNGVAERKHRHILETARSLLLSASVPSQFLAEALLTAVSFLNRIPSSVISGLSLFERKFATPPDYEELRVYRERMWW